MAKFTETHLANIRAAKAANHQHASIGNYLRLKHPEQYNQLRRHLTDVTGNLATAVTISKLVQEQDPAAWHTLNDTVNGSKDILAALVTELVSPTPLPSAPPSSAGTSIMDHRRQMQHERAERQQVQELLQARQGRDSVE